MHIKASDWYAHKHQNDNAYTNVVLHVVYQHDQDVISQNGDIIPCLEIQDAIYENLISKYQSLSAQQSWIPCQTYLLNTDPFEIEQAIQKALYEKLTQKSAKIKSILEQTKNDWEETLFRLLCRNFGFKINNEAFEMLADHIPLKTILKYRDQLFNLEALFFGQAGMLESDEIIDNYYRRLRNEYKHLQNKYQLQSLKGSIWAFSRLRPANFPTIRIAQLTVLLHKTEAMFSKILSATSTKELFNMLQTDVSWYWRSHYRFGVETTPKSRRLGKNSIQLLIINTFAPLIFYYGYYYKKLEFQDKAMAFLEELKPEKNGIIKKWQNLGVEAHNSMMTQGLIHLKSHFCASNRCLQCPIGHSILR